MTTTNLTVTEAVRNFSDYISRVAYRHETFVLRKGKKSVAELRPVPSGRRLGDLPEILCNVPHLSRGDATAFEEDVDRARAELAEVEMRDPHRDTNLPAMLRLALPAGNTITDNVQDCRNRGEWTAMSAFFRNRPRIV